MFIPSRCPRCREEAYWHAVDDGCTLFRIGWFKVSLLKRPFSERDEVTYRCDHCGYEGTYNDHAETLDHRRRL